MSCFIKFIALFLSVVNALSVDLGLKMIEIPASGNTPGDIRLVSDESPMCATAEYAANVKNVVQATYTTTKRKEYRMSNGDMTLTHKLTGVEKTASVTDKNGGVYIADAFRTFYTDKVGVEHPFENSVEKGRVNTIRLGEYYYECHIRDLAKNNFKVDKAFHVYADRLYAQYTLLTEKPSKNVTGFGSETTVPYDSVKAMLVKDARGMHSTVSGIDPETVEFAAFDIADAGVIGFIVPSDGSTQKLSVTRGAAGYIVKQYAAFDPSLGLNDYEENGGYGLNNITFGCRVYTDGTHSFYGVSKAAAQERRPLEGINVDAGTSGAVYLGYDALRGTYTLRMNGTDFQTAYDHPQLQFTAPVSISSDDDRVLYFRAYGLVGCLEAAVVLDENGSLVPMEVEVCKNFQGDGGEGFYGAKDYQYGDAFFPVCVKKGQKMKFTLIDLYQNWGLSPIKQLSSIEFHVSYYHISTGTTESNCIAPYFVGNKDGFYLPDFRNRSGDIWSGQPQYNSVGILKFMQHRDLAGQRGSLSELTSTEIASTGLAYCDIRTAFTDDTGNYTYELRHVEMPQTDENRTYYTMKVTFENDVTYADFINDFDLFYFDGRFVRFNKACYVNDENAVVSTDVNTGKEAKYYTLGSCAPFMGFYNVTADTEENIDSGFGCNFALLIRDSRIVTGGEQRDIPLVFREDSTADISRCALTLDAETISFKKGDTIELNMILLPWGTGRETDFATVEKVREDSALKPLTVTAEKGTVIEDALLPVVRAEENEAVFTVKGGRNNSAVTVTGLSTMRAPQIKILRDGEWETFKVASDEHGYDGYTVKVGQDGTYTFSFVYDAADPDTEYTFRVSAVR